MQNISGEHQDLGVVRSLLCTDAGGGGGRGQLKTENIIIGVPVTYKMSLLLHVFYFVKCMILIYKALFTQT